MKKLLVSLLLGVCVLPLTQSCGNKAATQNDTVSATHSDSTAANDSLAADTTNLAISIGDLTNPLGEGYMIKEGISEELTAKGFKAGEGEEMKSPYISSEGNLVPCDKVPYTKDDLTVSVITSTDEDYGGEYVEISFPSKADVDAFIANAKAKGAKEESANTYMYGAEGSARIMILVNDTTVTIASKG